MNGQYRDEIVGAYYGDSERGDDLPFTVDTVTISRKEYDYFVKVESYAREMYNELKTFVQ